MKLKRKLVQDDCDTFSSFWLQQHVVELLLQIGRKVEWADMLLTFQ